MSLQVTPFNNGGSYQKFPEQEAPAFIKPIVALCSALNSVERFALNELIKAHIKALEEKIDDRLDRK